MKLAAAGICRTLTCLLTLYPPIRRRPLGNGFCFTLITAYRVCCGSASNTPIGSSFNREHNFLENQGLLSPNPWQ